MCVGFSCDARAQWWLALYALPHAGAKLRLVHRPGSNCCLFWPAGAYIRWCGAVCCGVCSAAGGTSLRLRSSAGTVGADGALATVREAAADSDGACGLGAAQLAEVAHTLELMMDSLRPQLAKAKDKKEKTLLGKLASKYGLFIEVQCVCFGAKARLGDACEAEAWNCHAMRRAVSR